MPDSLMSFICGRQSVPWESASRLCHAMKRYRQGVEQTIALINAGYDYIDMDFPVNDIREVWKSQAPVAEAECTFVKQLWYFKCRKCGDPRDKIFAILGICKDVRNGDITVDYSASRSVSRVYSQVSKFIIMRDRSLKLLSACQSYGSTVAELPSWVPDWSIEARFRPPTRPISRWLDNDESHTSIALGGFSAHVEISADLQKISAQGFLVGKISVLGTHLENDGNTIETPTTQERMFTLFKEWWPLVGTNTQSPHLATSAASTPSDAPSSRA